MSETVTKSHWNLARRYGKPPLQSPLNDTLAALLSVVFSEEEANLTSHFPFMPATSGKIARLAKVSVSEAEDLLKDMDQRGTILAYSSNGEKKYSLIPIIPGLFELHMCSGKTDPKSQRFATLFEEYYDRNYFPKRKPEDLIKIIPVEKHITGQTGVLPSDSVRELIDSHTSFALAVCSCRHSRELIGKGCDKPKDVCMVFGPLAEFTIERNLTRRAEKAEIIEAAGRAEEAGLVHLCDNTAKANFMCSCCACCCGGLRVLTEFNLPGMIVNSHFITRVDSAKCNNCGKCTRRCPSGALTIFGKQLMYKEWNCIGCGLCISSCDKNHALSMHKREHYIPPHQTLTHFAVDVGLQAFGLKKIVGERFPGVYEKLRDSIAGGIMRNSSKSN